MIQPMVVAGGGGSGPTPTENRTVQYSKKDSNGYITSAIEVIDLEGGVGVVGSFAFAGSSASTIINHENVGFLHQGAFMLCRNLTQVTFPNVSSVGNYVFREMSSLHYLSLPKVESIGTHAFYASFALQGLLIGQDNPNVASLANVNAFLDTSPDLQIVVPDALVSAYRAAPNWSTFASQIISTSDYEGQVH